VTSSMAPMYIVNATSMTWAARSRDKPPIMIHPRRKPAIGSHIAMPSGTRERQPAKSERSVTNRMAITTVKELRTTRLTQGMRGLRTS
jgi:hypothetical protein